MNKQLAAAATSLALVIGGAVTIACGKPPSPPPPPTISASPTQVPTPEPTPTPTTPPKPADIITIGDGGGIPDCTTGTVTYTSTTTTIGWALTDGTWTQTAPFVVVASSVREATQAECPTTNRDRLDQGDDAPAIAPTIAPHAPVADLLDAGIEVGELG